jgi:hypothetical protein
MEYIKNIVEKENPTVEELISCLEQVKQNGDVAMIKFDGERVENHYTVFISFPANKKQEMIRADERILSTALIKVLSQYISSRHQE